MNGWGRVVVAGVLLFCLTAREAGAIRAAENDDVHQKGLAYRGSDPYAALTVARRERKLLLVEFYADWNHRSRWMAERVLGDSVVREVIGRHFVAVRVPTGTTEGAQLAQLYQVTGYPTIVIFNANGDVLDKIDTTLDAEDFEQRIRAVLMAVQGAGTWRLRVVYAAAEQADPEATDLAVARFLEGQMPQDVANGVVWPMFENSVVMRYGSTAFDYLVEHVELFRNEIGADRVDEVLAEALQNSMLPYTVGSLAYDSLRTEAMARTADTLGLSTALLMRSMADVARLRADEKLSLFIARLDLLLDLVPENYLVPLALSTEIVAERGTRDDKNKALEILKRVAGSVKSPANHALIQRLADRFK